MSTMFEHYDVGDEGLTQAQGDFVQGQSFTPVVSHTITSLKLEMYRHGSPGTIAIGIKATDVDGKPTGEDLCAGSTDGDTLPAVYAGEKREITLGAGAAVTAGVKYAATIKAAGGDNENYVRCLFKRPAPYPRGAHLYSSDNGVTWEEDTSKDLKFEEWGDA